MILPSLLKRSVKRKRTVMMRQCSPLRLPLVVRAAQLFMPMAVLFMIITWTELRRNEKTSGNVKQAGVNWAVNTLKRQPQNRHEHLPIYTSIVS